MDMRGKLLIARHAPVAQLDRALASGADSCTCFNPLPVIKPGVTQARQVLSVQPRVSIHSRLLSRELPFNRVANNRQNWFQSTPGY
ncbi:protein of unknown function [Methylocaldum szegediense]|uniref:Uncharacterized protein n=1 Tax=Methylocaldum szegediense TaxID=73780 RepID=A0ABM9I938_9GAMM|nr:protein of unknown function [Methylocaldum szegediense]